ncbi:unnamed protein product [Rhizoctonia solani]|uniref:Uncharacterized protein n=1 Tax=Rhizoctonia solani TaxID=456999 RepID=A0A8H3E0D7_9AGAM|nr:unnamed protein product [Rhizoctonia solani]
MASLNFRRALLKGKGSRLVSPPPSHHEPKLIDQITSQVSQRVCRPPIPSVSINDVDDAIRSFISVGADAEPSLAFQLYSMVQGRWRQTRQVLNKQPRRHMTTTAKLAQPRLRTPYHFPAP